MPSPFPGIDPYLEGQVWSDFHSEFIAGLRAHLLPRLRPRYVALIEERIYVELDPEEPQYGYRPDVSIWAEPRSFHVRDGESVAVAAPVAAPTTAPVSVPLYMPEEVHEKYLGIYLRESRQLVTVIELLSPSNKQRRGKGRTEYLEKRDDLLGSETHLVELDLLRGGLRLPMRRRLPAGDYYAIVSRVDRRPWADVWPFTVRDPMPSVPAPLAGDDPDVPLDLQAVFNTVYDRAGYDYSVDYRREVLPPLSEENTAWAQELLAGVPADSAT